MNPHFEVVRSKKLAYMLLKKCGCTSIVAALRAIEDSEFDPEQYRKLHDSLDVINSESLRDGTDWFVFTIVRDPIRRFLSFYSDKILSASLNVNKIVRDTANKGYYTNMCLDEAIDVAIGGKYVPDAHVVPQSWQIDKAGIPFDYVGRFENFNSSLQAVGRMNDTPIQSLHLNRKLFSPVMLNQEQFERLSDYYREDQIRFGYPQDYETWREKNLGFAGTEFQLDEGFVFEEEAMLLDHKVVREQDYFELRLTWRLFETQSRWRVVRLVEVDAEGRRVELKRYNPLREIRSLADADGIVEEKFRISRSEFPATTDLNKAGIEVYFYSRDKRKTVIRGFSHSGRLLLPLPPARAVAN